MYSQVNITLCTNKQSCRFKVQATYPIIPHSLSLAFKHFMKLISFYACKHVTGGGGDNSH